MKLKNKEILVMSNKQYSKHLNDIVKSGKKSTNKIILSKYEDLTKILTKERIRMLRIIHSEKPKSISDLAKLLNRDRRNVLADLNYLEGFGLVEIEETEKEKIYTKIPIVNFDELLVRLDMGS
jgi:predicted transcriptional regulator